jgi:hypothetical protein
MLSNAVFFRGEIEGGIEQQQRGYRGAAKKFLKEVALAAVYNPVGASHRNPHRDESPPNKTNTNEQ